MKFSSKLSFPTLCFSTLILTACNMHMPAISKEERMARMSNDLRTMYCNQEKLGKVISLDDAMARALKYNLDIRLKTLEAAFDQSRWRLTSYNMLPEVAATAGYVTRSNVNAAESVGLATGAITVPPSTSQDNTRRLWDLQGSWNVLDFGINYLSVLQHGDQFQISQQRRRKMIQNIMRDVRFAYWRALSAQKLEGRIKRLRRRVESAMRRSRQISGSSLKNPLKTLQYQKDLLESLRLINNIERNLIHAKAELTALMNVPPTASYELLEKNSSWSLPPSLPRDRFKLEQVALLERPELQEEDYRKRIAWQDIRIARMEMIPGFNILGGRNFDSNSFMVNNQWANLSLQLTWSILNVIKTPEKIRSAKLNSSIADFRRQALSMAIMTQVDVAYLQYELAKEKLVTTKNMQDVEEKIYAQLSAQYKAKKVDELSLIKSEANLILATLRNDFDYAEYQNSGGQLISTIGFDNVPIFAQNWSLDEIKKCIQKLHNQPGQTFKFIDIALLVEHKPKIVTKKTSQRYHKTK